MWRTKGTVEYCQCVLDCSRGRPSPRASRYPCLIDPTGQSFMFLKYRARVHSAMKLGDFEPEALRKGLLQCLHNGTWMSAWSS